MNKLIVIALSLFSSLAAAKTIRVAVIDTGINDYLRHTLPMCPTGHIDLTNTTLIDNHGHGSHIAATIAKYAGKADYCLVIIKYYDTNDKASGSALYLRKALAYANLIKVDIVNISSGGIGSDYFERQNVETLLNRGIIVNVAAGNDGKDLDKSCYYFPACYSKRLNVVGNVLPNGKPAAQSNYGKRVNVWREGLETVKVGLKSIVTMFGSSMATARLTGEIVNEKK